MGSPPPRERKDGTLKVLLETVLALVTLIAVSAVVLVMSQSRVSTHINRSTSQNSMITPIRISPAQSAAVAAVGHRVRQQQELNQLQYLHRPQRL